MTTRRRCRPVAEWPSIDQAAWAVALCPGDALEPGGLGARWAAASRRKTASGYGRWLTWLDEHRFLDPEAAPEARVTRERVVAYVAELRTAIGPHSVHCRVQELGDALRAMAPDKDWAWILRAAGRLRATAKSIRDKASRLQSPERIATLGNRLMAQADACAVGTALEQAMHYRDGLLIALLAHRPLRGGNLAAIILGRHLAHRNGAWWLVFEVWETKARQLLELPFPADLVPHLERYLAVYRPVLLTRGGRQPPALIAAFWVSRDGTALAYPSIARRVRRHTLAAFGVPLNPHLFRDCAATSIAIADPEHVRIIAAVLGHASLATSERHYNQARGLEAGRRYHGTIDALRRRTKPTGRQSERAHPASQKRNPASCAP